MLIDFDFKFISGDVKNNTTTIRADIVYPYLNYPSYINTMVAESDLINELVLNGYAESFFDSFFNYLTSKE